LLWVAPISALGYSGYMATAKKPPDKLAASLRHQSIDGIDPSALEELRSDVTYSTE
jgi:hypothetical protein